jgi:hypothetical protein
MLIGSPLLFVHGVVRVKGIRVEQDVDREPLAFYMCWFVKCACDRE